MAGNLWCMNRRINWVLTVGLVLVFAGVSVQMWTVLTHGQLNNYLIRNLFNNNNNNDNNNNNNNNNSGRLQNHKSFSLEDRGTGNKSTIGSTRYTGSYCKEQTHVVYIRIPKTGSSTMTFVVWKFGLDRNLKFLLPKPKVPTHDLLEHRAFFLPREGKLCDIMANVVKYTHSNYQSYFPRETAYVTLLRHPMNQLVSSIYYYGPIREKIPGNTDKVANYLKNPEIYETKKERSVTHNPMSNFMGLAVRDQQDKNIIQSFVSKLDRQLTYVLILERFDESLILMRKALCWPLKAILYKRRHVNTQRPPLTPISDEDYTRLYNWSLADSVLYEHFNTKLDQMIGKAGPGFRGELDHFRGILKETDTFCKSVSDSFSNDTITFPESQFSPAFTVSTEYCRFISTAGRQISAILLNKQRKTNFCNG